MDESEIGEEAKFKGEESGDVSMVEINAGDGDCARLVRKRSTVDAIVGAYVRADPVRSEITRIGVDYAFPCLKRGIGLLKLKGCDILRSVGMVMMLRFGRCVFEEEGGNEY